MSLSNLSQRADWASASRKMPGEGEIAGRRRAGPSTEERERQSTRSPITALLFHSIDTQASEELRSRPDDGSSVCWT